MRAREQGATSGKRRTGAADGGGGRERRTGAADESGRRDDERRAASRAILHLVDDVVRLPVQADRLVEHVVVEPLPDEQPAVDVRLDVRVPDAVVQEVVRIEDLPARARPVKIEDPDGVVCAQADVRRTKVAVHVSTIMHRVQCCLQVAVLRRRYPLLGSVAAFDIFHHHHAHREGPVETCTPQQADVDELRCIT